MSRDKETAWVLTSEYNDYDQHGEYFVAVWITKPDTKTLAEFFKGKGGTYHDVMAALDFILHLQAGGGRQDHEETWYNLKEIEVGKRSEPNE